MQYDDQQNGLGMPSGEPFVPYTPEQMQQWQQYGIPQQQFTPEILQEMQQEGISQPQVTPEMMQQWQWQIYQMQMQQMQQMQQLQGTGEMPLPPKQKKPKRQRKPKKKSRFGRIVRLLLILGVLGGGIWYFLQWQQGTAPTTATIEMGVLGTTYRGDALIVRDEVSVDDEGVQNIDYVAEEASVVKQGDLLCYVYSTGYNTKEMTTLQDNRDQIKNYQRTLLKTETQNDTNMTTLENNVIDQGLQVRSLVQGARGNLFNQEQNLANAIDERQEYFRSKHSSDSRLSRLYDDETTQRQRIDSWIKQHRASREGIISFYTDGYEYSLTKDYLNFTPAEVRAMIEGQRPETSTAARGRTSIYRVVTQDRYAVLLLVRDNTWNPVEGSVHKLMLEQFSNTIVEARIQSFTRSGGELLVRLQVVGDVQPVLYMRTCQAELGEYADCMAVPPRAIYEQNGSKGVVVINGEQQVFIPVNIVSESGGKVYISAIQTGVLSPGQTVRLF